MAWCALAGIALLSHPIFSWLWLGSVDQNMNVNIREPRAEGPTDRIPLVASVHGHVDIVDTATGSRAVAPSRTHQLRCLRFAPVELRRLRRTRPLSRLGSLC